MEGLMVKCADCGSESLIKNGTRIDKSGQWQVYKCNSCGHNQKGELLKAWVKKNES